MQLVALASVAIPSLERLSAATVLGSSCAGPSWGTRRKRKKMLPGNLGLYLGRRGAALVLPNWLSSAGESASVGIHTTGVSGEKGSPRLQQEGWLVERPAVGTRP
jgi:hypothetical protein